MLKALLNTLKEVGNGVCTEALIDQGFDYLIPNSYIYTMYSLKFEIDKNKFREYLKDIIEDMDIFKQNDELLEKVLETSHKWYCHLLDNNSLNGANSSLKSELKKLYKKLIPDLKGFDRFYERIYNTFQEAYNVYTLIFYNAEAIIDNIDFGSDRLSCYINNRQDYLTAIKQAHTYYVMIYKNNEPVTRIWFLVDEHFENVAIFNPYGFKFQMLSEFFSDPSKDELFQGSSKKLGNALGVYINDDTVLVSTDEYDKFVYKLCCPTCNRKTSSNKIVLVCETDDDYGFDREYKLKCPRCGNLVYSEIYKRYIPLEKAVYSEYHNTYLYDSDAVYSRYLSSYIYDEISIYAWNADDKSFDNVPKELTVYSEFKTFRIIKEQSVYSSYYDSYITKAEAIYCDLLDTYVSKYDSDFIKFNGKIVPLSSFRMVTPLKNYSKPSVVQYVGAWL